MRLVSLTLRSYRIHRDITLSFDPARNLIGGPNEAGKSTLAEAIHRALFFRHRSGGEPQRMMRSQLHPGHPEVLLVFETGEETWTLEKRFSGTNGTARLSSNRGANLQGDAAEEKLAQLIRNPDGPGTTQNHLSAQWAHLWVWQGSSGEDACQHAAAHKDELVQRLQENGMAAVMQSPRDESVRARIAALYEEIHTRTGSIKAGSKLDSATRALAEADAALLRAQEQKDRLAAAVADQEAANLAHAEASAALPALRQEWESLRASLTRAAEFTTTADRQSLVLRTATADREQLEKSDAQILGLLQRAAAARETLIPAEAKLAVLADQEKMARTALDTSETAHRSVHTEVRLARQLHDLANACTNALEKAAHQETLAARSADIATVAGSLTSLRESLATLPAITQERLNSLRKLDTRLGQSRSALAAMAAGIELVRSDSAVALDGEPLAVGTTRILAEPSEITIGSGTVIRIRPGGGNSLAEARTTVATLEDELARSLDALTTTSLEEAVAIATRRQTLEQQIAAVEGRLKDLDANRLPADLAAATAATQSAKAEIERRLAALPPEHAPPLPTDSTTATAWQATTQAQLQQAEQKEQRLARDADHARATHRAALQAFQSQRDALEAGRQDLMGLETSARTLEANHGDATTRAAAIEAARLREATARTDLAATHEALAQLNPDALASSESRIARVISRQEEIIRQAETRMAVARNTLSLDGSKDPEAELALAHARAATLREEHAREERRARSLALLHRLFNESQAAISESLTQPLADRVTGYLECLFGRGVSLRVDLSNPTRPSLHLTRPGSATFPFESLSGGAREQVAAALRLAMAEILAAAHHHCLPIVFDDAFAFTDPSRVQSLQAMLDLAARRGLQVIVLTCTPRDYLHLGAHEIHLPPTV